MAVSRMSEREVTFDVDPGWEVPDLVDVVPGGGRVETATHELVATYFDTDTSILRLLGLTLRHREGGSDSGWHLKIPAGLADSTRTEVHSDAASTRVPESLSRRLDGVVGVATVRPVATIRTTRQVTRVLGSRGRLVLEVADDHVSGMRLDPGGIARDATDWREVEIELGSSGNEADLARVSELFLSAGARQAAVQRKINHVLGEPDLPERTGIPGAVADYLAANSAAVLVGDILLRDDPTAEAVHQTRVAIRRVRSCLRSMARVMDVHEGALAQADEDLQWLGRLLSPIRDGDILGHHLNSELDALARADTVGPVREEIRQALTTDRREAVERWREAWRDDRYRRAMSTCRAWYASPPVLGDVPSKPNKSLRTARRRVERRLDAAVGGPVPDVHGLHQVRKAAKRWRYLADLLRHHVDGATSDAKRAKRLQTGLGEHQDLLVMGEFLRRMARGPVRNGFTYGLLAGRVDERAAKVRAQVEPHL